MTKAIIFSGSHPRHAFVVKNILEIFDEVILIVMKREGMLDGVKIYQNEDNQDLLNIHFNERLNLENKIFGSLNFNDHFFNGLNIEYSDFSKLNSTKTIEVIKGFNPDIAFVFGTGLISDRIISMVKCKFINLHLGLSPWYRGSATLFWPFYFLEPQFAGITLHQINSVPDAGNIFHQYTPKLFETDGIHDVGVRCVLDGVEEAKKLLKTLLADEGIEGIKQNIFGREWRKTDFNSNHLKVIYEMYDNKIVKAYLQNRLSKRKPKLKSVLNLK